MSIIDREIEAREQRDPSYVDADLQWAWARGYKACANREITEEEIAAAMDETRKFIAASWRMAGKHHQNRLHAARRKRRRNEQPPRP